MSWTRVQFKEQGRVQADAENSARWAPFTVNNWFRHVFDAGWRRILNADAAYRYTKLTVTPDSDGLVTLATIDAALGTERRYRILDEKTVRRKELATIAEVVLNPRVIGSNVKFTGNGGSTALWVNHMPQNPEDFTDVDGVYGDVNDDGVVDADDAQQIANYVLGLPVDDLAAMLARGDVTGDGLITIVDAQQISRFVSGNTPWAPLINTPVPSNTADLLPVTWPTGHEFVLANHLAGMLLTKGAVESPAAADIFAVTDALYTDMIQALMDRTTEHQQIIPTDSADSWSAGMIY